MSKLKLPENTPLEKEVAARVYRGIELLDTATPGWFNKINPATLKVSNRQSCVMAQASHDFKEGITQVALAAKAKDFNVRLMKEDFEVTGEGFWGELERKDGSDYKPWLQGEYRALFEKTKGNIIDVFYYGVAIDSKLISLAHGSHNAWKALTEAWKKVVQSKKAAAK